MVWRRETTWPSQRNVWVVMGLKYLVGEEESVPMQRTPELCCSWSADAHKSIMRTIESGGRTIGSNFQDSFPHQRQHLVCALELGVELGQCPTGLNG
jgi:hypothetical protein